jgi:hypothetical protein
MGIDDNAGMRVICKNNKENKPIPRKSSLLINDMLHDKRVDVVEITRLSDAVVVAPVGKLPPHFYRRLTSGVELGHVRWAGRLSAMGIISRSR